jgi:hypothetical protein
MTKKFKIMVLAAIAMLMVAAPSDAMMGGGMMTNTGGFGMMNGMAGTPVVGDDGTAYFVVHNPTANPGTAPTNNSFESNLIAVKTTGETVSITLKGIISKPVVSGNMLVATTSLPDFNNYMMAGNYGTNPSGSQSVIYLVSLPLTASSVPQVVSMDGSYASIPVIANNHAYVTTTDFGNAMMQGNTMFNSMFGNYNFNGSGTARSYLYIFNFDGTLVLKTVIQ